ncbi:MAG TPA: MFS transporter [Pyrinomonadaceae bacterium]|nr:MFS transporter [Pyrinomonadaceae bacterium]
MTNADSLQKNDRKEIFGWMLYDWANSAFYTTVIAVLLGPYLVSVAEQAVGQEGLILDLYIFRVTTGGYPAFCVAISVVSMVLFLPILGAIADYTHLKKRLMAIFCYIGVLASSLLFFVTGDSYVIGGILLIISNIGFAAANVFYNAFLVDIATEDKRDRVSSYGYGAGYIGGVIMLVANLVLINYADQLGISKGFAVRISFLIASIWWGVFGLISFMLVRTRGAAKEVPQNRNLVTIGFFELIDTLKELRKLRYTALFLIAYLFYNDGIQTVILQSSVFLSQELFSQAERDANEDQSFLIIIFLIAQMSALIGALAFERIARFIGAKFTILFSLAIWCAIVIFAYAFLETRTQALWMGSAIGLVLGSAQALSRSLYSQMIPVGRESAFFGLYEISEKGTSWMGQILFTIIIGATGSFRHAILGLIVFFVVGSVVLLFTNTDRAIHEAGNLTPEEAGTRAEFV